MEPASLLEGVRSSEVLNRRSSASHVLINIMFCRFECQPTGAPKLV